jgi:tetratricopeptide (TPR) repeat protein
MLAMILPQTSIIAYSPFITRSPNRFGELVATQDAYEPIFDIRSYNGQTLSAPQDLFVDQDDYLYVVDTGNKKVIIFDEMYQFITSFGEDILLKPTGIYVRDDMIYIADYGIPEDISSGRLHIYQFDKSTQTVTHNNSFSRPSSPVLEINQFIYRPQKIAVDQNHTMYVVSEGSYNGVMMINQENRFLSFFAPNRVQGTLLDRVLQVLYGNNEDAQITKKIPPAPTNVYLKNTGYVYTVTQTTIEGTRGDTLKKVNNGGLNFFPEDMLTAPDFAAASMGTVENIYAITRSGFIYEYDREGNLLFVFGGPSQGLDRVGLFRNVSSVAVNSRNEVIVLDDVNNNIHFLKPTGFADVVHEALYLYNQGKYVESQELWEEVLRYNALFDLAHEGIGRSYLLQGKFELALEKFEIAQSKETYSLAFWEVRNVWLQSYAGPIMLGLLGLYAAFALTKKARRNLSISEPARKVLVGLSKIKWIQEITFMAYYIKNPADACYEVKVRKRVSVKTGIVYVALLIALYMMHLLFTGILFTPVVIERTDFFEELLKVLAPFVTFVLANYLIASLQEGEGTLRAVFINTCGALIPVFVILPMMILLSNVLTYNEQFVYQFGMSVMIGWSAILLFFSVKDTHNFSVKETIYSLLMTLLMMVVMMIVVIMIYMMAMQVVEFFADIVKEVVIHA